ncbi:MAG TPA: hypothetical protein VLT33_51080 [Labilithrix sp.]|nr:hypothetical protein [Labilithrix sp.]
MDGRIVITFRLAGGPGRSFLERARALEARTEAHGAVLIGWGANRVSFAFDEGRLAEALALVSAPGVDREGDEWAWSVGAAQGDLKRLADDGSHGQLAWGPPLVAASVLAGAAQPGEVVCAQAMRALRSGELLAAGTRIGRDGELRVRGVRLDRQHPWRREAVEQLSRMRVAPLVGVAPPPTEVERGSLLVLRADPGTGGTRYLTELASRLGPGQRALMISPSGSGFEPLGALRRSFARSLTRELDPLLLELADSLEALVGGDGVTLETAGRLISAYLWPKAEGQRPGLLLIDDATSIDPATLEACATAARASGVAFGVVARLDATGGVPSVLGALPRSHEIEITPLSRDAAESLAGGCTNDALDPLARRRWARLAANVPLGVVEAVAYGIVSGDLMWDGDHASPRSRSSGRGKVRGAADWILLRARDESADCRTVLCLVALLGGEAKVTRLARVLDRAELRFDVDAVLEELMRGRWLVDTQEDWVGLPSRTHRDALSVLLEEDARRPLHEAAADILEDEEGAFGRVEAAWQAGKAGDGVRAGRILLGAARAATHAHLEASSTQLIAFARRADPSCEEAALELLASAIARSPSAIPPNVAPSAAPGSSVAASFAPATIKGDGLPPFDASAVHDSEPPTLARLDLAPMAALAAGAAVPEAAPESQEVGSAAGPSGANIASRLGELAKDALLSADNAALERWVDGLRAAGESPMFTERLRALSKLGRGDIGDALRVLRRTRSALDPQDHRQRCQTSLALGVALSVAGRPQEALLEGMDALARARHAADERGARACLAFLAKLFTSVGRPESERRARAAQHAQRVADVASAET